MYFLKNHRYINDICTSTSILICFVSLSYCKSWFLSEVKATQSCPTLWEPMDYIVHGILQARILEWAAFPFSRESSQPKDRTQVSCIAGRFFTNWAIREDQFMIPNEYHKLLIVFLLQYKEYNLNSTVILVNPWGNWFWDLLGYQNLNMPQSLICRFRIINSIFHKPTHPLVYFK